MPVVHHRRSIRLKGYDYSKAGLYFITICTYDRKPWFGKIEMHEMVLNEFGQIAYDQWRKLPERYPHVEMDAFQIMPNHIHGILWIKQSSVRAGSTPAHNPAANDMVRVGFTHEHDPVNKLVNVGAGLAPALGPQGEGRPQGERRPQGAPLQPVRDPGIDYGCLFDDGRPQGAPQHTDRWIILDDGDDNNAPSKGAQSVGMIVGAYKSLVANGCLTIFKSKSETMGKIWQRNYYEHIIRNEQSYWFIAEYIRKNPANWKDDTFYSK